MRVTDATLWGLSPAQLHDRFWAAKGVEVVRHGQTAAIGSGAELFLLIDDRSLVFFGLPEVAEFMCWSKPVAVVLRLADRRERSYREHVITDRQGGFVRFERVYAGAQSRSIRAALTTDRRLAESWCSPKSLVAAWRALRRKVAISDRPVASPQAKVYDRHSEEEVLEYTRQLVQAWHQPSATIPRTVSPRPGVWADIEATISEDASFVGSVWVGAGRHVAVGATVVGPGIVWDDPKARPTPDDDLRWDEIQAFDGRGRRARRARTSMRGMGKRTFDVLFAIMALVLTAPVYPIVMLAILIEDGWPFFFCHERETVNGRRFPCIKFRSMRKDAERIKRQLSGLNEADGPQFFIEHDPRLTRVGSLIRRLNIDELPQFINVLLGHMSVVGPRPSPVRENQFCPAWREARLSVRPGITGLWQVMRTRQPGQDFQEWIKYDIEYVRRANWRLDLWIIWRTIWTIAASDRHDRTAGLTSPEF